MNRHRLVRRLERRGEIIQQRAIANPNQQLAVLDEVMLAFEQNAAVAGHRSRMFAGHPDTLIDVPFCKGKISQLRSELKNKRKFLFKGKPQPSLKRKMIRYVFENQGRLCDYPHLFKSVLSPEMNMDLLKELLLNRPAMNSPVYFDFLMCLLNENTKYFDGLLAPNAVNVDAVYQRLREKCHNLRYIHLGPTSPADLIHHPNLTGLVSLTFTAMAFDDYKLRSISRMTDLTHLNIRLCREVTEYGISTLSTLTKLQELKYIVEISLTSRQQNLSERYAVLFFKYIPHANIVLTDDTEYNNTSYALWAYFRQNPVRQMGQRGLRLVDITDQHRELGAILPEIEVLHIDNKFQEFTQETAMPLMDFKQLSEIYFRNCSVHLCHKFFSEYQNQLVELTIKNCRQSESGLDLGLLFFNCHNLKKISIESKFAQETSYELKQAYFNALECATLVGEEKMQPPEDICGLMLLSPNLVRFSITADLINVLDRMEDQFELPQLQSLGFLIQCEKPDDETNIVLQNSMLKLLFNSPKLDRLSVMFLKSPMALRTCTPIKNMCESIIKVDFHC
ncbi:uncharacterized protein LOC135945847 [Cloeon dipterum]|uniref:uncharacterized protein LOC135945847 n=1 Tax=Cloeon dipterum TaxID=197152 RepID=UPI00321FF0CA